MAKAHVNLTTEEMLEDCREAIKKQEQEIEALKSALRDLLENPKPITSARSAAKHGFDSFNIKNHKYQSAVENAKKLLDA